LNTNFQDPIPIAIGTKEIKKSKFQIPNPNSKSKSCFPPEALVFDFFIGAYLELGIWHL